MKRLTSSLLFLVFALVLIILVGVAIQITNTHQSLWYGLRRANVDYAEAEVVTLGNSHCSVIDFKQIGVKGQHLWMTDMDLLEAKKMVEEVLPQFKSLKAVILHLSNGSIFQKNQYCSLVKDSPLEQVRRRFYQIYDFKYLIGFDFKNYLFSFFGLLYQDKDFQYFFKGEMSPKEKTNMAFNQRVFSDDGQMSSTLQLYTLEQAREDAQAKIDLERSFYQQINRCYPDIMNQMKEILKDIQTILERRGVKLILLRAPVVNIYQELYPKGPATAAFNICQNFSKGNLTYCLDYMKEKVLGDEYRLFEDSSHLNVRGIKRFSPILKKDLLNSFQSNSQ